jgi:hypothetical protein
MCEKELVVDQRDDGVFGVAVRQGIVALLRRRTPSMARARATFLRHVLS